MNQDTGTTALFADKKELQRIIAEQNSRIKFVPNPTATPERVQARVAVCLRVSGIRPEDNDAS